MVKPLCAASLSLALLLGSACAAPRKPAPAETETLAYLLGTRAPGVAWRRPLQLDLDGDGRVDFAALGTSSSEALVAVVLATASDAPAIFRFKRDATRQGALCGDPSSADLTADFPAEDDDAPASAREFARAGRSGARLDDGECDAFHFYFDGRAIRWWRR